MNLYRSFIPVKLSDKCIISFDLDFNESDSTMVGFGCHNSRVTSDKTLDKALYIDNNWLNIDKSITYQKEGDYLFKKQIDNSEFFGYKLYVDKQTGKVYEEIIDGKNFDIKTDLDFVIVNRSTYKHFPGKYIWDGTRVKLNLNYVNITAFYILNKGEVKLEKFVFDSDMQQYKGRLRFAVTNNGTVIDVSRSTKDNAYESVITTLYSEEAEKSYMYLMYEGITPKNFLINYSEASLV